VQHPRLARIESLGEIASVPKIKVADLRALDALDAEEVAGRYAKQRPSRGGTTTSATDSSVSLARR